jgi:gluconokinase
LYSIGSPTSRPGRRHRQRHAPRPEQGGQPPHDGLRGAALVEQLAEHGAEHQHEHHAPHRRPDAAEHRREHVERRHPVQEPDGERREQEREERVEPHHEHEEQHERDPGGNPEEWHRVRGGRWGRPAAAVGPGMVIVVMGPSGSGKTTVGTRLAAELGWPFHDGDDFHPPENVARMRAGLALGDPERAPWLAALGALVARTVAAGRSAVLACSALRQGYRRTLAAGVPEAARPAAVRFVYLRADEALLAERLARRPGHFFDPALLPTQLAALEEPGGAGEPAPVLTVDAAADPTTLVGTIRATLGV